MILRMLVELQVENFAVAEKLRVRFHDGLNVLTGETGSGKSLIVDALGLLMGGRASAEMIRSGEERAFVSGIFDLPDSAALRRRLDESGISVEEGELIVEREIQTGGKSRAFAGARPVTAAFLREIAPHLGDIHGQHDQQRLFEPAAQRELVDDAAGHVALLDAVAGLFREWAAARTELDDLNRTEQEKLRLADLWTLQAKEIEALSPRAGEDAELENESRVLKNVSRLQEAASAAFDALSDSEHSTASTMRVAMKRLDELARIDASLAPLLESLRPASIAVEDVAHELRHYLGGLEADPARLESVETRLAGLEKLKRKYGPGIDEILAFWEETKARLAALQNAGERRRELEAAQERLERDFRAKALELRTSRQKAARKLERQVEQELSALAMAGAVFRVQFSEGSPSSHGLDEVHFLVSTNKGEEPRPLEKVASGGELSRLALALKTCSKVRAGHRTLVFDEVDAGVGGSAAETVGRRLKQLTPANQVLCVTHLAQIAAFADHHFVVTKRETQGRTVSEVKPVTGDDRTREVGRMLSGAKLSPEALRHAEKLIADYTRLK